MAETAYSVLAVEMLLETIVMTASDVQTNSVTLTCKAIPYGTVTAVVLRTGRHGKGKDETTVSVDPGPTWRAGDKEVTWTDSQLRPGREYKYVIESTMTVEEVLPEGKKKTSKKVFRGPICTVSTPACPPSVPDNLRMAQRARSSIKVSWSQPVEDGGRPITKYILEYRGGGEQQQEEEEKEEHDPSAIVVLYEGSDTSFKHTGLQPGSCHRYRLCCYNELGHSPWTQVETFWTSASVPAQIMDIDTKAVTESTITLQWPIPDDKGSPIQLYSLEMGSGDDPSSDLHLAYTGEVNEFLVQGLKTAAPYRFRVRASNGVGQGLWSPTVTLHTGAGRPAAPEAPTQSSRTATSFTVGWKEPESNGSIIVGYRLQAKGMPDRPKDWVDLYNGPDTTTSVQGLRPGADYTVRVRATSGTGNSDWSKGTRMVTDPDVPAPVASIQCLASQSHSIDIGWTKPPLNGGHLSHYDIELTLPDGSHSVGQAKSGSEKRFNISNLAPASIYSVRVRAVNSEGPGAYSQPVAVTTQSYLPDTPAALVVAQCMATKVELNWTPPPCHGDAITAYNVYQSSTAGVLGDVVFKGPQTSAIIKKLQPSSTYYFSVSAANTCGVSTPSPQVMVQTACRTPSAPQGVEVMSSTQSSVIVQWQHPEDDGGSPVLGYVVEVSRSDSDKGNDSTEVQVCDPCFEVTGLAAGASANVRVQARNEAGWGPFTKPVQVSSDAAVPDPPGAPLIVGHSHVTVNLKWRAPRDNGAAITEYTVSLVPNAATTTVGEDTTDVASKVSTTTRTQAKVAGLSPETSYRCTIVASNRVGSSPAGAVLEFTTDPPPTVSSTPAPPRNEEGTEDSGDKHKDIAGTATATGAGGDAKKSKKKKKKNNAGKPPTAGPTPTPTPTPTLAPKSHSNEAGKGQTGVNVKSTPGPSGNNSNNSNNSNHSSSKTSGLQQAMKKGKKKLKIRPWQAAVVLVEVCIIIGLVFTLMQS